METKSQESFRGITQSDKCNECGNESLFEDKKRGDIVCKECGLVTTGHIIDFTSEWRVFSEDTKNNDPNRIGSPMHALLESNTGTLISKGFKGSNSLNERLVKTQNQSSIQKTDRFVIRVFTRISQILEKNSIFKGMQPRIEELFKLYFDYLTLRTDGSRIRHSLRKDETLSSIAACIFLVSRNEGAPRTFREIYEITNVSKKEIGARVRAMERGLRGIKISKIGNAEDYVSRFCIKLHLSIFESKLAQNLAKFVKDREGLYGKNFISVSAASIFIVSQISGSKIQCSLKEIADVSGISELTLKATYESMYPYRKKIINYLTDNFSTKTNCGNTLKNFLKN